MALQEGLPDVLLRYEGLKYSIMQSEEQQSRTMTTVPEVLGGAATAPFRAIGSALGLLPSAKQSQVELKVLDDVSGVIRPGTMTLLLSPPGGGKSTFLKALTQRMTAAGKVQGTVTYNGKSPAELDKAGVYLGQLCQYVDQLDNHMAFLSVRETLTFIAENALAGAGPKEVHQRVDEILELLHLHNCADTLIGNDLLRGVSGGEKKRVTIGEGIITNARFLALDEISTGLDAAVTYSIVKSLRERALANRLSVVIALLQPTPEVFNLFDDVILMREGAVVYHGPREALPGYLSGLGFLPPSGESSSINDSPVTDPKAVSVAGSTASLGPAGGSSGSLAAAAAGAEDRHAIDIADWLTELITFPAKTHAKDVAHAKLTGSPSGQHTPVAAGGGSELGLSLTPAPSVQGQLDTLDKEAGTDTATAAAALVLRLPKDTAITAATTAVSSASPPMTTAEFVAAWKASQQHRDLMAIGTRPEDIPSLQLKTDFAKAQYGRAYVHNPLVHAKSLLMRQVKLMTRNKLFIGFRVFSAIFMSIVFGGLFWQGGVEQGLSKYGLFLNACMHVAFANISEMSSAVSDKYIGYRQVANGSYPAWTYPLAAILSHIPLALAESLAFGCIMYFMVGLTVDAGRFFFFTFVVFLADVWAALLFRTFAYSAPTLVAAQAGPMPVIALLIMFAGFMVTRGKMGWMQFLYYLDFFAYGIHSMAMNEFSADRYQITAQGATETLGTQYLTFFEMETQTGWKWGGIGFMCGSIILTALWSFWAFSTIRFDRNIGSARLKDDSNVPAGALAVSVSQTGIADTAASRGVTPSSSVTLATQAGPAATATAEAGTVVKVENPMAALAAATAAAAAPTTATAIGAQTSIRSVLPFVPQTVAWKDLTYTVSLPKQLGGGSKTLLRGVTGYALPGRLLALMGASGAGKTTLLDVLAGRKNSGVQTGSVYLNGHPKEDRTFNRVAAYCEQQDLHYPLTTVREALEFSAALRLPASVSARARSDFVDEVMEILELTPLSGRKVGDPGDADGLAPGERKRLTIGVELVSNAPVIFLDEPTSGLDSRAAQVVMKVIRAVASTGRTVICTIHQPSAELFNMFDDLLLLQRGGYQTYFGPLGVRSRSLLGYLESIPGVHACPQGYNPATYMLDVLAGTDSSGTVGGLAGLPGPGDLTSVATPFVPALAETPAVAHGMEAPPTAVTAARKAAHKPVLTAVEFQDHFFASPLWVGEAGAFSTVAQLCTPAEGTKPLAFDSPRARSFFAQYTILVQRQWKMYLRNIPFNVGRLVALVGLCTLFGTIYYKLADRATDVAGVQSLVAAIFMTSAFSAMLNMDAALPTLVRTRPNFYREQASLLYDPGAFSLSSATVEVPWLATAVMCGVSIAYFMIGLSANAGTFFFHYLVTLILACVLVSLGWFVAAAMPSFDVAQAVIGTAAPVLFLFGGMFAPPSQMPPGSRWVNTIDPITYAFSSLVSQHFHCDGGQAAGCPTVIVPHPVYGPIPVDRDTYVTKLYELNYSEKWVRVGYLAIFVAVFQCLAIAAVRYVRHIVR